jgi:hypothetical protein
MENGKVSVKKVATHHHGKADQANVCLSCSVCGEPNCVNREVREKAGKQDAKTLSTEKTQKTTKQKKLAKAKVLVIPCTMLVQAEKKMKHGYSIQ